MRLKKILITIDPECEKHLENYKHHGFSASYILREALKRYSWQVKVAPVEEGSVEVERTVEYD